MSKWSEDNRKKPKGSKCEAKTRSGRPCENFAMPNGRCRLHGGVYKPSPGQIKKGERRAWKHGLYSDHITDEEITLLPHIPLGNIDDEIKMLKIQLRRYHILEKDSLENPYEEIHEVIEKPIRTPFDALIRHFEKKIKKLENRKKKLLKKIL